MASSSKSVGVPLTTLWALITATLLAVAVIILVSGGHPGASSTPVVHSANPFTPILRRELQYTNLPALAAARRNPGVGESRAEHSVTTALLALKLYQSTGNARFLGAAKSAIAAWEAVDQPPPAVWLLRGRIAQTEHRFAEAARDLARFNRVHSGVTEALLLEADAWRRTGEIAAAKTACMRIALNGRMDLAQYCSAEILLSVGQPEAALALIQPILLNAKSLPQAEQQWASAIHADLLYATSSIEGAAEVWATIAADGNAPLTYQLAYADVLLSLSRFEDVVSLLGDNTQTSAALLRVTLAATRLERDDAGSMRLTLQRRLEVSALTSTAQLHLREQALYALWLDDDACKALQFALRNWELQKGWEDAALVQRIANSLNDSAIIQQISRWQDTAYRAGSA
ncbi:hypothetical protein [Litorivivens sp.]|uniref:hypothetical protein n=1 Tax=Litorivivens sp. TaxID=2020868 RepID=UPI003561D7EE